MLFSDQRLTGYTKINLKKVNNLDRPGAHMGLEDLGAQHWLALVEYELLLFAGFFFLIGALDELAVDIVWGWLRLTGRARAFTFPRAQACEHQLAGRAAVFIPTWQEDRVISDTIAHALAAWKQTDLRLFVGCYGNDAATVEAAMRGTGLDPRVRLVVHDNAGPTTKADCLNRLYRAMEDDERRTGIRFRMVLLHDAEDMVDSAALGLLDQAMDGADFVQLPVLPVPQRDSRWVGSHYCEEFAEAHGKTLVVRDALTASLPAAGVGCVFGRDMLERVGMGHWGEAQASGPFSVESLTEDYELGLKVAELGGQSRFLRVRDEHGRLVATRAYFPGRIDSAVRQKSRWVHGIALQGWERLGWTGGPGEFWMRLRDRRGLLSALVLLSGYALLVLAVISAVLSLFGQETTWHDDRVVLLLVYANLASFVWRAMMRFAFTAREYGAAEGARSVLRIPVSNIIAILAARRALSAYLRTLAGSPVTWEKTDHDAHPVREQAMPELKVAA